jgi:hypothetical protein
MWPRFIHEASWPSRSELVRRVAIAISTEWNVAPVRLIDDDQFSAPTRLDDSGALFTLRGQYELRRGQGLPPLVE